ncbi:MAG: hypothetical protein V9H26_25520 [Verrucomicrobiota bacterium]
MLPGWPSATTRDRAIGPVGHPADQVMLARGDLGVVAKGDALHAPVDSRFDPSVHDLDCTLRRGRQPICAANSLLTLEHLFYNDFEGQLHPNPERK